MDWQEKFGPLPDDLANRQPNEQHRKGNENRTCAVRVLEAFVLVMGGESVTPDSIWKTGPDLVTHRVNTGNYSYDGESVLELIEGDVRAHSSMIHGLSPEELLSLEKKGLLKILI